MWKISRPKYDSETKFVYLNIAVRNNMKLSVSTRCGRVVTDFDWEAKNRFNF